MPDPAEERCPPLGLCTKASGEAEDSDVPGDSAMITSNPMQLKTRIKNLAAEKSLPAQIRSVELPDGTLVTN